MPSNLYDEYLCKDINQAEDFVRWLDTFMTANLSKISAAQSEYQWLMRSSGTPLSFSRLNTKAVEKFIKTSLERYRVSPSCAPIYSHTKKIQDLHYQVKYAKDSMSKHYFLLLAL